MSSPNCHSKCCSANSRGCQQTQQQKRRSGINRLREESAACGSCCSCQLPGQGAAAAATSWVSAAASNQHRQAEGAAGCGGWGCGSRGGGTNCSGPNTQTSRQAPSQSGPAQPAGGNCSTMSRPGRVLFSIPTSACRSLQCDCSQTQISAPLPTDPALGGRAGMAQQALLGLYGPPEHLRHHSGLVARHPTEKKFGYIVPLCMCSCGQFVQGRNGVMLKCRSMLG